MNLNNELIYSPGGVNNIEASTAKYILPGGGGGTRGVRHTGVCRSNRSLFWEKSLNIGYGFELENLKHTPHFCNFAVDTRYFRPFRR